MYCDPLALLMVDFSLGLPRFNEEGCRRSCQGYRELSLELGSNGLCRTMTVGIAHFIPKLGKVMDHLSGATQHSLEGLVCVGIFG